MLHDVIKVKPLEAYRLYLWFDDGLEGVINVRQVIKFEGVFHPLQDPAYFKQVFVHPELGTVCWPNQADLDSDVLYQLIVEEPTHLLATA